MGHFDFVLPLTEWNVTWNFLQIAQVLHEKWKINNSFTSCQPCISFSLWTICSALMNCLWKILRELIHVAIELKTSGEVFGVWYWTFGSCKKREISWTVKRLLSSLEAVCSPKRLVQRLRTVRISVGAPIILTEFFLVYLIPSRYILE
jgi:hypothetical protein